MSGPKILTLDEYEAAVVAGLARQGIEHATARRLLAARWPMTVHALLGELAVRGLALTLDDFAAYLRAAGVNLEEVGDLADVLVAPHAAERFLGWCLAEGRGKYTALAMLHGRHPQVLEALQREAVDPAMN